MSQHAIETKKHSLSRSEPGEVGERLMELGHLRDGWMDGQGVALPANGLRWLADAWAQYWPAKLLRPFVYPMLEGGVQMEWALPGRTPSVEIDLVSKHAVVYLDQPGREDQGVELALATVANWSAFVQLMADVVNVQCDMSTRNEN